MARLPTLQRRPAGAAAARRLPTALALLAASAFVLPGCGGGGGGSGTSADPASAVPASAPIYAGADVRPSGSEQANAAAVGRSITHQGDPYLRLVQVLQTPGSPQLEYGRDIAPWLGPHAGVFLTSLADAGTLLPLLRQGLLGSASSAAAFPFGSHGAQGAIVMDTSDSSKARSFLNSQAAHAGAHATSYRGVSYEATAEGIAFAMVDRFAVIGSEAGVHGVIDTTLGGAALLHASGYAKLLADAPAGALAHLYTNPTAAAEGGTQKGALGLLALLAGARESNISLVPASGSVSVYVDAAATASTSTPGGLLGSVAEGSRAFDELPGDSWLAIGLGHLGSSLGQDVLALRELAAAGSSLSGASAGASSGPLSLKGLVEGLLAPLSALGADTAQAKHDFSSWMGSGGVYASGSGLLELKGAVVIESTNPALSRAAVQKLAAQLRLGGSSTQPVTIPGTDAAVAAKVSGLPVTLVIANGRDAAGETKFVLGLGEASVTDALSPSTALASAASRSSAAATLGEGLQPSLLFEVPTLLALLEGVGLTEDPTISKLVPYLHSVATIAGGGHALASEVERFKLSVGLR
ncbi:MAG TPA: DUF3352 domain-containing protein [Solirubrobacteraceae bacterium]|nr:DUF3352 domain-containing protein [Solirubrobacteraceae bacterium]